MSRTTRLALNLLVLLAALEFLHFYVWLTHPYLDLPRYIAGTERMPFQMRVLPIPFLMLGNAIGSHMAFAARGEGVMTREGLSLFLLATLAFGAAAYSVHRLYRAVSVTHVYGGLVLPLFIALCLWTYTVHVGEVWSYPYDLPALAFFTAGLATIYERRFGVLLAVVVVGSFNRETTLFLIAIYLVDACSAVSAPAGSRLRSRFRLPALRDGVWPRLVLLGVCWLLIDALLRYHFRFNDRSEDYIRITENLHRLLPREWPAVLNMGAYTLPAVLLLRRGVVPTRFGNYLVIVPLWVAVMLVKGVITETRIYGELTGYLAVAVVLLMESQAKAGAASRVAAGEADPVLG